MKKYLILVLVGLFASGCSSSVVTKNFKVITDPPDSVIKVVSGAGLEERKYSSPAEITAKVPEDPALAAKAILEVRRDSYKPVSIALSRFSDGDTVTIKLEKILQAVYRLTYRLISPSISQELQYRDKNIAVSFAVGEQSFQMRLENLSPYDIKILWEQAEYVDVYKHGRRLMHSGIRYPDRNNPIPPQIVRSHASLQESVIPVNNIYVSRQKGGYDIKPLFSLGSEAAAGLKGKSFNLFIPVEINRQIIPYNFKIEILDLIKDTIKG